MYELDTFIRCEEALKKLKERVEYFQTVPHAVKEILIDKIDRAINVGDHCIKGVTLSEFYGFPMEKLARNIESMLIAHGYKNVNVKTHSSQKDGDFINVSFMICKEEIKNDS